jgi:hypothetical protein
MTTHDRIDCARINQEIIKLNYARPLPIVHASSSPQYTPYLEDVYVRCDPRPLKAGSINLIQKSISATLATFDARYIVHIEGDTWLIDESVIHGYIAKMEADRRLLLCTCSWNEEGLPSSEGLLLAANRRFARAIRQLGFDYGLRGLNSLGTQFFILRNESKLIDLISALQPVEGRSLEEAFYESFTRRYGRENILRMREREPVHPTKRDECRELSLYCQHWPARGTARDPRPSTHPLYVEEGRSGKKEALERHPAVREGPYLRKLLESSDLAYYNPGAKRY